MNDESISLGEALPKEITRVRDTVLPAYVEIGNSGAWAAANMRADLDAASKAMIEGDTIAMLRIYKRLKEWKT